MTVLSSGFSCMYPDCFNCDHADCDAPPKIDSASARSEDHKRWVWSEAEYQYLVDHPLESVESIAKELGRSVNSIKTKISLHEDIQRVRSKKRQEIILAHIKKSKNIRTVEIAWMMHTPIGIISNDIRQLQKKHAEIKRKNGNIKWIECV